MTTSAFSLEAVASSHLHSQHVFGILNGKRNPPNPPQLRHESTFSCPVVDLSESVQSLNDRQWHQRSQRIQNPHGIRKFGCKGSIDGNKFRIGSPLTFDYDGHHGSDPVSQHLQWTSIVLLVLVLLVVLLLPFLCTLIRQRPRLSPNRHLEFWVWEGHNLGLNCGVSWSLSG